MRPPRILLILINRGFWTPPHLTVRRVDAWVLNTAPFRSPMAGAMHAQFLLTNKRKSSLGKVCGEWVLCEQRMEIVSHIFPSWRAENNGKGNSLKKKKKFAVHSCNFRGPRRFWSPKTLGRVYQEFHHYPILHLSIAYILLSSFKNMEELSQWPLTIFVNQGIKFSFWRIESVSFKLFY